MQKEKTQRKMYFYVKTSMFYLMFISFYKRQKFYSKIKQNYTRHQNKSMSIE